MSKRADRIVIPISFEDEKQSLSRLKTGMADLQKSMSGFYGKELIGNMLPELSQAIKLANKEMSKINKPLSSKKEAENLGNNIAASLKKVSGIIVKLQTSFKELFDPKEAMNMAKAIKEATDQLSRLKNVRDKWSEANKTISSTGDKTAIARNLKINQGRQGKLTEKSTKRTLSSRELEELTLLKQKELEYLAVLDQKKQAEAEIAKLKSQNNVKSLKELDDEIKKQEDLITRSKDNALSFEDYEKANESLNQYNKELDTANTEASNLGTTLGNTFEEQRLGQAASIERQKTFNAILRETLGITISLQSAIRIIKRLAREAFDFYKSLDTALTDISIVSNMTRSQVQALTSDFITLSAKTGMAIDDIAKASVIFFQQGLSTPEVLEMTEVTAQFAKVAGSTVEKAADQLTAAVNGYKVGVEGAIDVADKLNAVAAKSAASIDEIATAMSKAASQANQAGLSMDKFYAILATVEEVTREAPENIGTSLKTIMARMQQIKEGNNTEDDTDVNAVETALKSVGISLRDTNGQLKDLEKILDELGPLWNAMDRNTQAYLGTIIAGTRQQSRFISMMQNWDRVLELTKISQDSAGQQALMHEKAMQGLDAAINTLTNSWQKFLTSLTNSDTFISILNIASEVMQNLSRNGAKAHLITAGLVVVLRKFSVNMALMGNNIKRSLVSFKKYMIDVKKGYKPLTSFNKSLQENYDRVKATKAVYDQATQQVQKYAAALRLKNEGENSKYAQNINQTVINLEKEIAEINKKVELTEEDKNRLAELNSELERYNSIITASKMSTEQLNGKMQESINKERESKEAYTEALTSYQKSASAITTVVGVIETLISVLGLSDQAWANMAIGAIAAIGTIYLAIKAANDKAMKMPIYAILSLGLTAVTGIVQGFKLLLDDGTEALAEAKEKADDAAKSFQNIGTKLKGIDEYLDVYTRLSKKIMRTKEEQEELNEAIQGLSELTGVAYTDNQNGIYDINIDQVRDRRDNSLMKEYEAKREESNEAWSDVLNKQKKVQFKQKKITGKQIGALSGVLLSSALFGVPGFIIGTTGWAAAEKKIQEEIRKARSEAFDTVYKELSSSLKDIVSLTSDFDEFGNMVLSASSKAAVQDSLKEELLKDYREMYANQEISEDKLLELVNEDIDNYSVYFSKGRGATIFREIGKNLEENQENLNNTTYNQMLGNINKRFDELTEGVDKKSEEYKYLLKTKQAEMNALWSTGDFNLQETLESLTKTDPNIGNALKNVSVGALKDFNDIGLMSGDEFSKGFLQYLVENDILGQFVELYSQNYQQGLLFLEKILLQYAGTVDDGMSKASEMISEIDSKLSNSFDSWSQWGTKIKDVSDPLKNINSVLKELQDTGEMTMDTFLGFLDVLDDMSHQLEGDDLAKFTKALLDLDFNINANTGNITANGKAIKSMKDIYTMVLKAKLLTMSQEYEAEAKRAQDQIDNIDTQIEGYKKQLEALKTEADGEAKVCQYRAEVQEQEITNSMNAGNAEINITRKKNQEVTTSNKRAGVDQFYNPRNITKGDVKANTSQNSVGVTQGPLKPNADAINKAIAELNAKKGQLEKQRDNAKAMAAWLKQMSKKDWSKYGLGGNKSSGSKSINEYMGKLNKILELLSHIEQEEAKINTLEKLRGMQTGRANIKNLLEEIKLTEHLQKDYVKKYNLEKNAALELKKSITGGFGKVISFNEDGSYNLDKKKYDKLKKEQQEILDGLVDDYKQMVQDATASYDKIIENIKKEMEYRQEAIDKYIEGENKLVEAIKTREKKILDAKLKAIDKEIEAIEKVSEARRKARKEENDAAEISGLQVDLQRALMDSSGASASQILSLQKQIKDKQKEMADNSFDDMVNDMKQQLEDEKEMEQALFDERLEEMDWYWAEVDRIMGNGVQSVLDTMKLYSDEYNQASEVQQAEVLKGWTDTFEKAVVIGKIGAQDMQAAVAQIQDAMNNLNPKDIEAWLNFTKTLTGENLGIQDNQTRVDVNRYASGGMNYRTGLAWLDGTRSNPEAVLNAAQTKAFLSFADDLAALRASGAITNNSNVVIDTISFNVESMSSPEDGEKAFDAFVDRFKQIGAKQGISINGTANRF